MKYLIEVGLMVGLQNKMFRSYLEVTNPVGDRISMMQTNADWMHIMFDSNLVVDLTNNRYLKIDGKIHCMMYQKPYISCSRVLK